MGSHVRRNIQSYLRDFTLGKQPLLAAITGLSASVAGSADYRQNPFTLVYEGAITENQPGKVNIQPVTYKLNGLNISANVYTPANYDPQTKYSAIVVAHPNGGVKEQVAGLFWPWSAVASPGCSPVPSSSAHRVRRTAL